MVELKDVGEKPEITNLPLKPLRYVRVIEGSIEELLAMECDDYVSIVLTDQQEYDFIDVQTKLYHAFPHALEIKRKQVRGAEYQDEALEQIEQKSPLELFCELFPAITEEEKAILTDVVNAVEIAGKGGDGE